MSVSAEVFAVRAGEVHEAWPTIAPFLEIIDQDEWTPLEIQQDLLSGVAQAWGMRSGQHVLAIWIIRICDGPNGLYGLSQVVAGAPLEEGLRVYREHIEPYFLSQGCEYIKIIGRRGWKKVLPDYEERQVIFTKRLR